MNARERLIIALDVADIRKAIQIIEATQDSCETYKIGLEFFLRFGMEGVRKIQTRGIGIFLDLKLHDIPNTVYSALLQVLALKPRFITVHASGGTNMLLAAKDALIKSQGSHPYTKILAVSVLTHLSSRELKAMGIVGAPDQIALRWLKAIRNDALFGAVCSPHEANFLRASCAPHFTLVCPGIRPEHTNQNDQTRIATPRAALQSGANYLVVGRPITGALHPTLAARSIINEMESVI